MTTPLLLALAKKKEIDVSAHIDVSTQALWIAAAAVAIFFILRPELWRRIFFERRDARPAALTRIAFGITIMWTFLDLLVLQGEFLFTDQGLLLTEMARKNYGGKMRTLWDPEYGVEHWWDYFMILTDRWTVLFIRSDPPFVYAMFGVLFFCCTMMIIGWRTRLFTVLTWLAVLQLYNYNPIYFTGGDTVLRVHAFFMIFVDWGQAYSVDSWRKRRKAISKGETAALPDYKQIAGWPRIIFMIQLAAIYSSTGLLKSGKTWADGTALYYALNLDHFYRFPNHLMNAWMTKLYITRGAAILVHWWEILFPLLFLGEALRGWDRDEKAGTWQGPVPRWTLYCVAMAASIYGVWYGPSWTRPLPLLLLAGLILVDRMWLKEADTSGKGALSWVVRVSSWACVVVFFVVAAYMADLGVHYYYKPGAKVAAFWKNKEMLGTLASVMTLVIPAFAGGLILGLRRWAPKVYLFVRDWLLGKRFWLVLGFLFHLGIDASMNVGTFVQVMIAVYPIWLAGQDIDKMWWYLYRLPAKPGEGGRPAWPEGKLKQGLRLAIAPFERAVYRVERDPWVVVHGADDVDVRRVALLRCWDLGQRLRFELDEDRAKGAPLTLRAPDGKSTLTGADAGAVLIPLFPGLWWLWPLSLVPGVGKLAVLILRQRG
ncbi:HTTM domain-containing protein [Plesiocystis pacifica]|nr:HTTM domain-containing protein [Plesiocystis pacifica]